MLQGKKAFIFKVQNKLPNNYLALLAFDTEPVTWQRVEMSQFEGNKWWAPIIEEDESSRCAVHAVLRSNGGVQLPEAYLLGPTAEQVEVANGSPCCWKLFAAYEAAVQTLDSHAVAKPKQQGCFRMGDHVTYSGLAPVGLSAASGKTSHIPTDGEAIVCGFAIGEPAKDSPKSDQQSRRFVILRVDNDSYCLGSIECIAVGSQAKDDVELKSSTAAQKKLLQDILGKQISRTATAVSVAMDRERKLRMATAAAAVEEVRHQKLSWCCPCGSSATTSSHLTAPLCRVYIGYKC